MYKKVYSSLWGAAKSEFFGSLAEHDKKYLVLTDDSHFETICNEFSFFLKDKNYSPFPSYLHEPFEYVRIIPTLVGRRVSTLLNFKNLKGAIVLTNLYGLTKRLPTSNHLRSSVVEIFKDGKFSRDELVYYLDFLGYINVEIVTSAGEFSYRGDIVDLFPSDTDLPLRIEFFDDEVEKISFYSIETQKRVKEISSYKILPASEGIYDLSDLKRAIKDEKIKEKVELYGKFAGHHWYAPEVYQKMDTLLDYIGDAEIYFIGDSLEYEIDKFYEWVKNCSIEYNVDDDLVNKNFITKGELLNILSFNKPVKLTDIATGDSEKVSDYRSSHLFFNPTKKYYENMAKFAEFLQKSRGEDGKVVISVGSEKITQQLSEFLRDYEIEVKEVKGVNEVEGGKLSIFSDTVTGGFYSLKKRFYLFKDEDIFGFVKKGKKRTKKEVFRTSLSDLEIGDYVVHVDYGIGVYRGLENKTIGWITGDFVSIEYDGGEILYVSLENISLIQKYIGVGDKVPKLNSLQSTKWKKLKENAEKSARKIAIDLLKLYAERKAKKGFSFRDDGELMQIIANSFEYDETEDQLNAINDVLRDMESESPMDRLVCGDVGFGKTEVAVRAACKCCASHKQVAILSPTTILVKQHYETFVKRFKDTPIKIDYLSRFKSNKEIKKTLEDLANGVIDIIIGTHRLLSGDVVFYDLGLLIIDEEQRFGVAHKERIKNLKSNIDVLAMSATPIPRTLQLSLVGIREISIINTPPEDRLPVVTHIIDNMEDIKKAIIHELKRGGQVYYLCNDLSKIEEVAYNIKTLIPEASISIAHGQMESSKVEKILEGFYNGEIDILVASTIIENGLDVPNVNTIIIEDADRFGLSQLYQLKGRVGRSNRRGYCYLYIKNFNVLTPVAKKRLRIIQQMSELGSGFKIASYDLQLRGAGEILGAEQSGHISSIGYELYIQMIQNAVKELQGVVDEQVETEIQSVFPYYIPANYIIEPSERIGWYSKLSKMDDIDINRMIDDMREQYGEPPDSVVNMLYILKSKKVAIKLCIKKIIYLNRQFKLVFDSNTAVDPLKLLDYIRNYNLKGQFLQDNQFIVVSENPMEDCLNLLLFLKK